MADIASLASTTLARSETAAIGSAFASATAIDPQIAQLAQFNNMSTKQFDAAAYSLNYTQTGCYRQGSLPVALASNDTCLPGWHCTFSIGSKTDLPHVGWQDTDTVHGRSKLQQRIPSAVLSALRSMSGHAERQRDLQSSRPLRAQSLRRWALLPTGRQARDTLSKRHLLS